MKNRRLLLSLHLFNAVTSIAGGIALIGGFITPPLDYIKHTDFASYYFPGVILLCVVGGGASLAVITILKKLPTASLVSITAGLIMLFWIICEVISIREFNFLQAAYIATASLAIYKTPTK